MSKQQHRHIALLESWRARGIDLVADGDKIRVVARRGVITDADRQFLALNKTTVLDLIRRDPALGRARGSRTTAVGSKAEKSAQSPRNPPNPPASGVSARNAECASPPRRRDDSNRPLDPPGPFTVEIGDRVEAVSIWDGERLEGTLLGFDTETTLIDGVEIPDLALAAVSSGDEHFLVHPDRLGAFLRRHRDAEFVLHNCAFDYWVVARHLAGRRAPKALRAWEQVVEEGRMHDTMLLDQLIRLARTDAHPFSRDLGEIAREYAGLQVDKLDPYRVRYGEIIGRDWAAVERGFLDYAVKDPIATLAAYIAMSEEAANLMEAHGYDPSDASERFGLLSEAIQVKGAIALARISRAGMYLDVERLASVRSLFDGRLSGQVEELMRKPDWRELLKLDRDGNLILTSKGKVPSQSQGRLRAMLASAADEVSRDPGRPFAAPLTPKGKVSLKAEVWDELAPFHPLVHAWIELGRTTKMLQFFRDLDGPVIHPSYRPLVRTGRTSCSAPNVQNLPRKGGVREAFVASPGHLLLAVDYSFIELRTLAAECEARYDSSKLADVIRAGIDPHCHSAAIFNGITLKKFMSLKTSAAAGKRERYETLRQRAKVLNFGIPGGLGPRSLVAYAKSTYGVVLSLDDATRFRLRLIEDVYPELGRYLEDDGMEILARNMEVPVEACWSRFDWNGDRSGAVAGGIRNVVRGKTHKADGKPYVPRYLAGVWDGLNELNRNPSLVPLLASRVGGDDLQGRLFRAGVTTLTGRVRGRVGFTQARNTPFQGLAADGAKLALWALSRARYRVVAFIHDEVLIELPEDADHAAEAARVAGIMEKEMERVTGGVPVATEYALCRRWSKKAKAVFDGGGRLLPWEDRRR